MPKIEIPIGIKKSSMLGAAKFCRNLPLVKNKFEQNKGKNVFFTFEEVVTIARIFTFKSLKEKKDNTKDE